MTTQSSSPWQNREQFQQRIQDITRKMQSAENPQEFEAYAKQLRSVTDSMSSSGSQKTAVTVDAIVSGPEALETVSREFQSGPLAAAIKEVSYRRESDGTPRIRFQATHEALPQIRTVLETLGRQLEKVSG